MSLTFVVLSEKSLQLFHVPLGLICNNFGYPFPFNPAISSAQIFDVSNAWIYDQINAKPMTLPPVSASLCV